MERDRGNETTLLGGRFKLRPSDRRSPTAAFGGSRDPGPELAERSLVVTIQIVTTTHGAQLLLLDVGTCPHPRD